MKKFGLALLLAASSLAGCNSNYEIVKGKTIMDGYEVRVTTKGGYRVEIFDPESAKTIVGLDTTADGEFDAQLIQISYIPKGDKLESYANPKKLREAFEKVKREQNKR